jgi:Holliday junction resolvase
MKHKTDANHRHIVDYLRACCVSVADTSKLGNGFPDIVCGHKGKNYLFEIKVDKKKRLTPDEETFSVAWKGQYQVITTPQEALEIMGMVK